MSTCAPSSLLIQLRLFSTLSAKRSATATILTEASALAALIAAPVPRPPQPTRPTRIGALASAEPFRSSPGANALAAAIAPEVARNSRRDT
jgi:hypothetical protein